MNSQSRMQMNFFDEGQVEKAKETAIALSQGSAPNIQDLLFSENLEVVEQGIRTLNEFADKCWLLSAMTIFSTVYSKNLYQQSGLSWSEYVGNSRERLGLCKRELSEQLSSARFFVTYYERLKELGWSPIGSARKLSRAELALELSGDIDVTLEHITNDSWKEFHDWYGSFKIKKVEDRTQSSDIVFVGNQILVDGKEAVKISDEISENDRVRFTGYIRKIFEAIKNGKEPAIFEVSDKNEIDKINDLLKK